MKIVLLLLSVGFAAHVSAQTRFTQSSSQGIFGGTVAACVTSGPGTIENNRFMRVFHNDNYNIQDTVFFVFIELGVESTSGGSYSVVGRVHELNGPLEFANMTLLAADTAAVVPNSGLYKMIIPIKDGYTLPGDSVVAEVFAPFDPGITFYPGCNPYPETGVSYIAAANCGMTEPTPYASVGYPAAKLVLNLWVNHKPVMGDLSFSVFKDNMLELAKADLEPAMSDHDSDTIALVRIFSVPVNGTLEMNGTTLVAGDTVYSHQLDSLTYIPAAGYYGADAFTIQVRDHSHWSNVPSTVAIDVLDWELSVPANGNAGFVIYPNPASAIVRLDVFGEPQAIEIYNAKGRLVERLDPATQWMDIADYPAGIYFVAVRDSSGSVAVQKLMKQ